MSLRSTREHQSKVIWDVLFCCELWALFGTNTNEERAEYLSHRLRKLKTMPWAYKSLNRVARSNNISSYVVEVGEALQPRLVDQNVVYHKDVKVVL